MTTSMGNDTIQNETPKDGTRMSNTPDLWLAQNEKRTRSERKNKNYKMSELNTEVELTGTPPYSRRISFTFCDAHEISVRTMLSSILRKKKLISRDERVSMLAASDV